MVGAYRGVGAFIVLLLLGKVILAVVLITGIISLSILLLRVLVSVWCLVLYSITGNGKFSTNNKSAGMPRYLLFVLLKKINNKSAGIPRYTNINNNNINKNNTCGTISRVFVLRLLILIEYMWYY